MTDVSKLEKTELTAVPRGNLGGFTQYFRYDFVSGFLVFLIALPLCLGISMASGYPPIAGIFTAIIGALLTTFISNSEMTIKGPAAGLIVIAIGCIEDFGGNGMSDNLWSGTDLTAYKAALAVGVAAAVLQILFGLFRAGILSEFFPTTPVHGMLAAIGLIIIIKQFPVALGVSASGEPLEMLKEFPNYVMEANPAIAAIGVVSLLIMFLWPLIKSRVSFLKFVPAQLVVLVVAIPMGMVFDLLHEHTYTLSFLTDHDYQLSDQYLVKMPDRVFGMFDDITLPAFGVLGTFKAWKWVAMFFLIGTLESVLSAKAVDLIDPYKRKSSMNRDILAVGTANLASAFVGGLPMISEIVRSRANIDNGAKTRFADFWHGLFLLACVALIPMWLHRIPLAALAAMLVYTGYRLAHPKEFMNIYRIGKEQLLVFVVTLFMVLYEDLLVGVACGIALKFLIHILNGVSINSLFKPYVEVREIDERTNMIVAKESAVFSNWIPFRRQIEQLGLVQNRNLIIDLSDAKLVDHSVMAKLDEVADDFAQQGLHLEIRGLDSLQALSDDAHAARKKALTNARRVTLVTDELIKGWLEGELARLGGSQFVLIPCQASAMNGQESTNQIRIEFVIRPGAYETVLEFLRNEVIPKYDVALCVEHVDIVKLGESSTSERDVPVSMTS